jgi:hypothetical protein
MAGDRGASQRSLIPRGRNRDYAALRHPVERLLQRPSWHTNWQALVHHPEANGFDPLLQVGPGGVVVTAYFLCKRGFCRRSPVGARLLANLRTINPPGKDIKDSSPTDDSLFFNFDFETLGDYVGGW